MFPLMIKNNECNEKAFVPQLTKKDYTDLRIVLLAVSQRCINP